MTIDYFDHEATERIFTVKDRQGHEHVAVRSICMSTGNVKWFWSIGHDNFEPVSPTEEAALAEAYKMRLTRLAIESF